MTKRNYRLLAAAPLFVGGALLAVAPVAQAAAPSVSVQALRPSLLTTPVTDEAGVLTPGEISQIEDAIAQVSAQKGRSVRVVFLDSFEGTPPSQWTEDAVRANGPNTAVIAISPNERAYSVTTGEQWSSAEADAIDQAAYAKLTQSDWAGAALAAVEAAGSSGAGSSGTGSAGGESTGLIAGGAGLAAVAGGGYWAVSRRKNKQHREAQVASARELAPGDADSLNRLPTSTLDAVAQEALVAADESVQQGQEELRLAISEFGADRVRPFTAAMNSATTALQRAFRTQQALHDAIPETEPERRAMLIDIITSARTAEASLRAKTEEFNSMRGVLMRAPEEIEKVMQRTVDLRSRLEPAKRQLAALREQYPAQMLHSIDGNVELAAESLDEAEAQLDKARGLTARPAGEQGPLLDVLSAATRAVELSDHNLSAIEHADANIRTAKENISALIQEIRDEIEQIAQLKGARAQGADIDVAALDRVTATAREAIANIGDRDTTDPLSLYADLSDVDAQIDAEIERAEGAAHDQSRALTMFDQQMQVATTQIQSAEDMIRSRGRIISSQPRTLLAQAQREYAEAQQRRTSNTREAIEYARQATTTARRAIQAAKDDLDQYRRAQARDTANSMAQAVLWGSILSGGGNRGGSFGGGGFGGGGGFSGGGGGGGMTTRGGTF
ncbi:TPM domain-containing protein [Corynebacterium sp. NML120713]|uniref:TPM domain-containing protein n=1 Tax=Corynebacterium sp. NML120713 TaxID=1906332 RepID=UPI0008FB373C|nr:TPM domain-containing protein [Corynebacterium sp. NML120713]OIR42940.1 chromosome partitioning protein ParA [Corynebacterium sp. NML120713]